MPELPEVESARTVLERHTLRRNIVGIDAVDSYVGRPFQTEDFRRALIGARFTHACRRGKTLWLPTTRDGPVLGLHLGMGGRIVVTSKSGEVFEGGDSARGLAGAHQPTTWDRLTVHLDGGRALRLVDKQRLGRAVLDPDLDRLGRDALTVDLADFRNALGTSTVAIKARLLDQSVLAGVGNLLADETLWRARIDPTRRTVDLTTAETGALHRAMRAALKWTLAHGGSHTGHMIAARHAGGHCPRCGGEMRGARIGGRSTWSCSVEQR